MIETVLKKPVTLSNIRNLEELGVKDLVTFIPELKRSSELYGNLHGSKKFRETVADIKLLDLKDYRPAGWWPYLVSMIGRAGLYLAYQPAVTRLNRDLSDLKASLNRLLLMVENPSFEEVLTENQ